MFVTNVFEQTVDKEMDLMCNQVISKILEKLLAMADRGTQEKFAQIILKEMRIICTDPYASHVLECLMHIFMEKVLSRTDAESGSEHLQFCEKWLCSVVQFTFNNVEDFIVDIYASHIIRTSLQCVSGVQVGVNVMKSQRSRNHLEGDGRGTDSDPLKCKPQPRPEIFMEILREFAARFVSWPQLLVI